MKINWNKKYTTIAVYAFIVICLSIAFANILSQIDLFTSKMQQIMGVFHPFIIGFVIAYLLNFILKFYEDKVFSLSFIKKNIKKSMRGLGISLSYLTAGLILYIYLCSSLFHS